MFKKIKNILKKESTEDNALENLMNESINSIMNDMTINAPTPSITSTLLNSISSSTINSFPGTTYGSFSYNIPITKVKIGGEYDTVIFRINDETGKNLVSINTDGTIDWGETIEMNKAAEALAEMLQLSTETAAKITERTKIRIRDSVFQDIINIAKEKGPLSAEELTYLLEASKIVEKLKTKE